MWRVSVGEPSHCLRQRSQKLVAMWEEHPAYQRAQTAALIASEHYRVAHETVTVMRRLGCEGVTMSAAAHTAIGRTRISGCAYIFTVVYEHVGKVRTVLLLTFEPDGEVRFPPVIYLDPPLTNWFRKAQL